METKDKSNEENNNCKKCEHYAFAIDNKDNSREFFCHIHNVKLTRELIEVNNVCDDFKLGI